MIAKFIGTLNYLSHASPLYLIALVIICFILAIGVVWYFIHKTEKPRLYYPKKALKGLNEPKNFNYYREAR